MATIALVNMLNDFFAKFMLKVDVNIGRFIARLRDETFKQHGADFG